MNWRLLAILTLFTVTSCGKHKQSSYPAADRLESGLYFEKVITPNIGSLPYTMKNRVKEFHLVAEPVTQEIADGIKVNAWGYNGSTPGPTIEAVEGDTVRIIVTNKLSEPTTIHWHGILLPNDMDGVSGLTQAPIAPKETFVYEFPLRQHGTYMYHPQFDEVTQISMGMMGFFIIHPKESLYPPVDQDFALFTHEWRIPSGSSTPDPLEKLDFNYFTFNGHIYPKTSPLIAGKGQRVRIRFANLGMNSHPIHLHGFAFTVTASGGWRLPSSAQYRGSTIDVNVGSTYDIEFIADEPGDWALLCDKTHHTTSGMQPGFPNMIGVEQGPLVERIRNIFPGYFPLGTSGRGDMFDLAKKGIKKPKNFPPFGSSGPFGDIQTSGMFTIIKVRERIPSDDDPGWYADGT